MNEILLILPVQVTYLKEFLYKHIVGYIYMYIQHRLFQHILVIKMSSLILYIMNGDINGHFNSSVRFKIPVNTRLIILHLRFKI